MERSDQFVVIPEDDIFPLKSFDIPDTFKPYIKKIVIPHGLIVERTKKMAKEISKNFLSNEVVLICVLNGALRFYELLLNELNEINCQNNNNSKYYNYSYVRMKNYINDKYQGTEIINFEEIPDINGKDVVIVEDIIDTGKSMLALLEKLKPMNPTSIKVCRLLNDII